MPWFRASKELGFNVVNTQTRPCTDVQKKRLEAGGKDGSILMKETLP